MSNDAIRREAAVVDESTFATAPGDWDTGPTQFHLFAWDGTGVGQDALPNTNFHVRPTPYHPHVLGLKSGKSFSFSTYFTATGTNAAEQATATTDALDILGRGAMGGLHAGDADGFSGLGTAAAPEVDTIASWAVGDWMFAWDDATSEGEFIQVKAKPGGNVITPHRTLSFTPGATDVAHAVITWFFDTDALSDHSDGEHKTQSFFFKGHDAEDLREYLGCKGTFQLSGLNAGEMPSCQWSWMAATFNHETLAAPTFGATPDGQAPLVTGTGDDTSFYYGNQDTYTSTTIHSFAINMNYSWTPVPAVNGTEGVAHYFGRYEDATITIVVDFDDNHATDYRAKTEKCCLLQVGSTKTQAIGIHCPRLQIIAEPKDVTIAGGRAATEITLRALENDTAHSLTGADKEKFLSAVQILRVA